MDIDWPQVINWIVEGAITFVFTFLGAYVAFRFALMQDERRRAAEAEVREQTRRREEAERERRELRERLTAGTISANDLQNLNRMNDIIREIKREGG